MGIWRKDKLRYITVMNIEILVGGPDIAGGELFTIGRADSNPPFLIMKNAVSFKFEALRVFCKQ